MSASNSPDFNDNNFLKNWLERRYGNDFATYILDDISKMAECETSFKTLDDISQIQASNDNAFEQRMHKIS